MTEHDPPISPEIKFHLVRKIECHKIVGLARLELMEHEAKYLEFHRIAGVILFGRNVESFSQVRDLVESVRRKMAGDGLDPIVAVDHEGDFVSELKKLIGIPPSAMAIAATGDPDLAYDVALETGQAMAKLGVNAVFAPGADVGTVLQLHHADGTFLAAAGQAALQAQEPLLVVLRLDVSLNPLDGLGIQVFDPDASRSRLVTP